MNLHGPTIPLKVDVLGFAIKRVSDNQNHIGVLYTSSEDGVMFCHLAWHHQFRDEPPKSGYHWGNSGLDVDRARLANRLFRSIAKNKDNASAIPYGFDVEADGFDKLDGAYILSNEGHGMTCATFVLSVFDALRIPILDLTEFTGCYEDDGWRDHILTALRKNGASTKHCDAIEKKEVAVRVKPEHVAAGMLSNRPPAPPEEFVPFGQKIHDAIS